MDADTCIRCGLALYPGVSLEDQGEYYEDASRNYPHICQDKKIPTSYRVLTMDETNGELSRSFTRASEGFTHARQYARAMGSRGRSILIEFRITGSRVLWDSVNPMSITLGETDYEKRA